LLMTELQRAKTVQSAEDLHVSLSLLYIKWCLKYTSAAALLVCLYGVLKLNSVGSLRLLLAF
jgi:hypothetical protein